MTQSLSGMAQRGGARACCLSGPLCCLEGAPSTPSKFLPQEAATEGQSCPLPQCLQVQWPLDLRDVPHPSQAVILLGRKEFSWRLATGDRDMD